MVWGVDLFLDTLWSLFLFKDLIRAWFITKLLIFSTCCATFMLSSQHTNRLEIEVNSNTTGLFSYWWMQSVICGLPLWCRLLQAPEYLQVHNVHFVFNAGMFKAVYVSGDTPQTAADSDSLWFMFLMYFYCCTSTFWRIKVLHIQLVFYHFNHFDVL